MTAMIDELRMGLEEYLALERATGEGKSEYWAGKIVAMSGATGPHNLLGARIIALLDTAGRPRGCSVFTSDQKVWAEKFRHCVYPDVSALCDEPRYLDDTADVLLNPSLIVEVLSPSTEAYDRGKKLAAYMAVPSVIEVLLVSQWEVRVEKFTRGENPIWHMQAFEGLEARLPVRALGCELALSDVYGGIKLADRKR